MDAIEATRAAYGLLAKMSPGSVPRLRAWDGSEWGPTDAHSTLVLQHPGALRAMLLPPTDLSAAEAYVYDDFDIEGDICALVAFGADLQKMPTKGVQALRLFRLLRKLPDQPRRAAANHPRIAGRLHSLRRDRGAVTHHYDTGNEFFAQVLDPLMVYSCAHFLTPSESLESAQRRKLDMICRKLQLAPGDTMLDVGCGWGGLVIHAATHYGAHATGITLSAEQAELARMRAKEAGVNDRATIEVADYREVKGSYDSIASVGMFEHVGRKQLPRYFSKLRKLLAPGGLVLNHGIVTRDRSRSRRKPTFVNTYVFPDGDLLPLETGIEAAEHAGFEVRDIEALRASYAMTLRRWVANIEDHADAAIAATSDFTYRIWRLYMAGSAVAFERSALGVYQLLLADPARSWTFGRKRLLAADDLDDQPSTVKLSR